MPSCFLVLQRFFLRVDDVLFRIFDTRIWVDFQSAPPGQLPSTSIPSMAPTSNPSTGSNGVPWANQASRGGGTTGIPRNVPTPSSIGDGLKGLNLGPTRKELKGSSKPDGVTSAGKSLAERNAGDENGQIKIIRECSGSQAKYSEVKSVSLVDALDPIPSLCSLSISHHSSSLPLPSSSYLPGKLKIFLL